MFMYKKGGGVLKLFLNLKCYYSYFITSLKGDPRNGPTALSTRSPLLKGKPKSENSTLVTVIIRQTRDTVYKPGKWGKTGRRDGKENMINERDILCIFQFSLLGILPLTLVIKGQGQS